MKFLSTRWRTSYDLLLAVGALVALLATIHLDGLLPVRRLLALSGALFCPGYLLLAAMYPQPRQLNTGVRLVGSMAVSVAMVVLLGLALNQTWLGIDTGTFTGSLLAVSCLLAVVAYHRRQKSLERDAQAPVGFLKDPPMPNHNVRMVLFVGAVGLAIPLIAFYYVGLFPPQQQAAPTTQFYLEPVSGNLADLALRVEADQPVTVILGLVNLENRHLQYEIYREIDGEQDVRIATVDLDPGQDWRMPYTLSLASQASARRVVFSLFREDDATGPYRTVYLWLKP
jgi:uncharacterized membrane protein